MTDSIPRHNYTALLIFALSIIPVAYGGCATPSHENAEDSQTRLEPWTPTRKGNHPADVQHAAPSNWDRSAAGPDWLEQTDDGDHSRSTAASPIRATGFLFWRLYSNTLSRTMGDSCRFSPSCSRFAVEAAASGPQAAVLAFGRLQRSHLDDDFYEHTADGHLYDPPSHYFFWRSEQGLDAHRTAMPTDHAWYVFIQATDDLPESFFDE